MSSSLVRLRICDLHPEQWADDFRDSVRSAGSSIRVIDSVDQIGLGALDTTVLAAMIAGGAQVVTAVVTALMTSWLAARKDAQRDRLHPVEVVLVGSRSTVRCPLPKESTASDLEKTIAPCLGDLGELREITISPSDIPIGDQ